MTYSIKYWSAEPVNEAFFCVYRLFLWKTKIKLIFFQKYFQSDFQTFLPYNYKCFPVTHIYCEFILWYAVAFLAVLFSFLRFSFKFAKIICWLFCILSYNEMANMIEARSPSVAFSRKQVWGKGKGPSPRFCIWACKVQFRVAGEYPANCHPKRMECCRGIILVLCMWPW